MEKFPVEDLPVRKPVDEEIDKRLSFERLEKQWALMTEAVRRELAADFELRKFVAQFVKMPVSEKLADEFFSGLAADNRAVRLRNRFKDEIGELLALPEVPDDLIVPDIKSAEAFVNPKEELEYFAESYGEDSDAYQQALEKFIKGRGLKGITGFERFLVRMRYKFARDIKMLALTAEFLDNPVDQSDQGKSEFILPSGIEIHISPRDRKEAPGLLEPQKWIKREQIKDRVYVIQVGSSKYILKEKKTARHKDTKERGHIPGLSSLDELKTGKLFGAEARRETDDIVVSWEQPIGVVVFPDGFQFTVFKFEPGLLSADESRRQMTAAILENRQAFERDYEEIRDAARKLFKDKRLWPYPKSAGGGIFSRRKDLTFEEYAKMKASWTELKAFETLKTTVTEMGYENSDMDGYAYRVKKDGNRPKLEIIGFDFEYFSKISPEEVKKDREVSAYLRKQMIERQGIAYMPLDRNEEATRIQAAAFLAMIEREDKMG